MIYSNGSKAIRGGLLQATRARAPSARPASQLGVSSVARSSSPIPCCAAEGFSSWSLGAAGDRSWPVDSRTGCTGTVAARSACACKWRSHSCGIAADRGAPAAWPALVGCLSQNRVVPPAVPKGPRHVARGSGRRGLPGSSAAAQGHRLLPRVVARRAVRARPDRDHRRLPGCPGADHPGVPFTPQRGVLRRAGLSQRSTCARSLWSQRSCDPGGCAGPGRFCHWPEARAAGR